MKQKLVWRLGKLPSVGELQGLVQDKIITQEEAREILFSFEDQKDVDVKSLQSEIKFLRSLVESLSENRTKIVETIREVEVPYKRYPWYGPYAMWSGDTGSITITSDTAIGTATTSAAAVFNAGDDTMYAAKNFSDINTF